MSEMQPVPLPVAVAAPVAQTMSRPQGASPQVDALIESLGGRVTIKRGSARYGMLAGYDGTHKVLPAAQRVGSGNKVAADLPVLDARGKEALVLSFQSSDRSSIYRSFGEMQATLKGTDGTVIFELQREGIQAKECQVRVGGMVEGKIVGTGPFGARLPSHALLPLRE